MAYVCFLKMGLELRLKRLGTEDATGILKDTTIRTIAITRLLPLFLLALVSLSLPLLVLPLVVVKLLAAACLGLLCLSFRFALPMPRKPVSSPSNVRYRV